MFSKIILLFCVLTISFSQLISQTYFSTNNKKICDYNKKTAKYDKCREEEMHTLFKMNKAETMIDHTTPDLNSTYYVDEKKYDDSLALYMYMVTSDVGNKYIFLFDIDKKEIRVLGQDKSSGNFYIVTWYIKSMWTDEQ